MGVLFQNYMDSKPADDILRMFRLGVTNTYNNFYRLILDEKEILERTNSRELIFFITKNFEIDTKLVINLFNEIGYNIEEVELKKDYIEELGIYEYHYSVKELWDFVQGLDDEYFYGVMVYLSQTSTTNKILLKLQQAVKDELLRNRITIRELRKTVFIAMSFASDMEKARESIMRAIEDKGYKAVVIDEKEHNEQIVPQIFEEINRAEFIIADLTGHRNGVYYEAGFARGLNKQVVFTCRADDFENSHFDVKQVNTIRWENEWILEERLRKRIEAMMTNELDQQHVPF